MHAYTLEKPGSNSQHAHLSLRCLLSNHSLLHECNHLNHVKSTKTHLLYILPSNGPSWSMLSIFLARRTEYPQYFPLLLFGSAQGDHGSCIYDNIRFFTRNAYQEDLIHNPEDILYHSEKQFALWAPNTKSLVLLLATENPQQHSASNRGYKRHTLFKIYTINALCPTQCR